MTKKTHHNNILHILKDKNCLNIFMLGIASGIPIVLILSTLSIWLKEIGTSKTIIGLFALTTMPYTLKFLWSPLIDGIKIPILYKKSGMRKSWLIITQISLFISICLLAISNPGKHLEITAICTLLVSFLSATQDIVIDAYRIEILDRTKQGLGATSLVYGYRIGMLISGAGALILAEFINFMIVYIIIALCFLLFAIFSYIIPAPYTDKPENILTYSDWIKKHVISPFQDFLARTNWLYILLFIMLFKLGDAFAGIMTNPFLLELNFSKADIAIFVKTFGLFATLSGALIGGILCAKYSIKINLLFAGIIQMLTNFIFCLQALVGNSKLMLGFTIGAENLAGGIGTVVFVAYISNLCNIKYTATQYALLSSLSAVARTWFSSSSGWFSDQMNWVEFFAFSAIIAIPGILMIYFLKDTRHNNS